MPGRQQEMDQGWAWVVLGCSWMSLFLVSFLTSSAGIMQVEIVEDLGVGSGPVSIMTSCCLGLASLLGPLSGVMASLLSARVTVFLGAVLMSLGLLATSFSYSIPGMMIFYGIVTGFGFGIAYSPIVVIISFYFEKYRMLANGVILCSSGVGMVSLPFFERYIIDSHGWRFAFAINGTIMLHILVFSAAFFPTHMEQKNMIPYSFCQTRSKPEKRINEKKKNNNILDGACESEKVFISCHEIKKGVQPSAFDLLCKSGLVLDGASIKSKSQTLSINGSSLNITNGYIPVNMAEVADGDKYTEKVVDEPHLTLRKETHFKNGTLQDEKEHGISYKNVFRQSTLSELSAHSSESTTTHASTHFLPPATTAAAAPETYKFGQLRKASSGARSYLGSGFGWASSDLGSSLMLPVKIEEVAKAEIEEKSSLRQQIVRICRNKAVWILSINSLFFMGGYAIHGVHFPAFAESKGMTRPQVAEFYIVFGLVLMSGRLGGGWLYNKLKPPLCVLMFILQSLNGISMALAPFYATTPVGIYIMQASFGLLYGQSYMVLPAVIAQIMGVLDLTIAFGIIHLFMGLGHILAPAIAGFIYDVTETYDIPYYIGGALYFLGALSLLLMTFVKREDDASDLTHEKEGKEEQTQGRDEDDKLRTPLVESHITPVARQETVAA